MSITSWRMNERDGAVFASPMLESLESRLMLDAYTLENGVAFFYTDANGSDVTVKLTGGVCTVDFPGEGMDGTPSLTVVPSNNKSSLTVTVKNADKSVTTTTIGDIVVEDAFNLKTINAKAVELTGTLLMVSDGGAKITLGAMLDGSAMTITGEPTATITLTVGAVGTATISSELPLAFSAVEVTGASLTAVWFTKLTVSQDMTDAVVKATGEVKGVSIATMTVGRELGNTTITAAGSIARLTAGAIHSDMLGAVYGTTIVAGSIGTLTVKGYKIGKDAFVGNMKAELKLSGALVAPGKLTLTTVKVSGRLSGDMTIATGSVGTITVGGLFDYGIDVKQGRLNRLTAGYADDGAILASSVGTLTFKGDLSSFLVKVLTVGQTGSVDKITVARGVSNTWFLVNTFITSLTVGDMGGGSVIQAGSIGTLRAKGFKVAGEKNIGSVNATIQLDGRGVADGKNTLNTVKVDLLRGSLSVQNGGNVGTLTAKDMTNARVDISGKVKTLKTDTLMTQTQPGMAPASITVTGGGTFTLGTGKTKLSIKKSTETVTLYIV